MVPRGRGRGALQGAPPVIKSSSSYFSYNQSPENPLMDLRITEIIDVTTFWAQVGTAKQLSDFDQFCVSLSAQCEDQETSSHDTPIIVGHIVPVKDAAVPGVWHRARVTRILPSRTVEVHFVDTGKSGRVSICDLCTHVPKLTLQIPSQALQCNLDGVTMVQGNDVIREAAIARLSEIVSRPLKTIIHSICDDVFFLSAYTRQKGYWTSVGEILRLEGLAKYTPPGSLTVDHLISPSLLPRETTPPNDYESDSSTLIDIEVSHSLKWSDTKTKTQPSFSVSVPEVAVCNDLVSLSDDEAAVSDSIWLTPPSDESELQSLDFSLMITSVETQLRVSQSSGPFTPTETPPNEVESNSDLSLSPPLETTAKPKAFSLASPKLVVPFSSLSQRCDARSNAAANKENKSFIKLPTTSSSVDRESDILQNLENDESGNTKKSDNIQATTTTETNNTATIGQNALDKKDVTSSQRQDTSAIEERDTEEEHETDRSSSVSKEDSSAGKQSSSVTKRQSTPSKKVSPDSSRSPTETGHKGNEADSEEESSDDDDDEWDESLLPPRSGGSQPGSNNSTPMNTPEKNPPADEKHYHGSKNRDKFRARFDAVMGGGESYEQRQWKGYRTGGKKYSKRGNNQPWQQNYIPRPRPNNWRAFSNGQNGSFGQNRALGRGARIREDIGGNWSHPSYQDERHQHYRDDFPRGSQYDNSSPRFATPRSEGSNFEHLTQPDKRLEPPSSFAPGPVERGSGESTTTRSVTPKPETRGPGISLEVAAQRAQLSAEAKTKECNWHAWKIENAVQKIISNLTEDTVKEFEQQLQDILDGTSAKTLTDLQYEKKPLTVVFNSVLSQVTMEKADLITEAISIAATNFQGPPAYKILQDAVYTAAEEVSMGSADTFAAKKRGNFCSFAQKLFISASYSGNEEYSRCIGLSLKRCLKSWINCSTQVPKVEQLACAECFVALCDNIGPTLDAFSKESLDEYFNGPVRESILCNDSPREVKEKLLDLSFRRVGNWGGAKPQKPSEEVASPTSQSSSEPPFTNCSQPTQATSPVPPALQPPSNMVQKVTPLSPDILQQQSSHQHASSPPFPSAFPQQMFPTPPNVQSLSSQQPGPLSPPAVLQSPFDSNQQFSRSMLGYPSPVGLERRGVFSSQHFARNQELFSPHYYVNSQQSSATPSLPQPPQQQPDICEPEDGDPYRHTLEMLETLGFPELLPNFKQHMLRDFVFDLDKDMTLIKECLTSAQLPLGAVVGIMSFLENKRKMKQRKPPTLRPNNHIPNSPLQSPYQFDVRPSPQAMLPQLMPPTPHLQAYCLPPVQPFMQAGMNYAAPNPVTPTSTVIVTQASVPQTLPITLPAAEVSAAHLPSPDGAATTAEADSSGGLTVRRPSSHRNWHKPEPEPPKDGVHSNSKPQVGGGFGKFSCVLCHSNEHSTMTCDHRDRFFVHM